MVFTGEPGSGKRPCFRGARFHADSRYRSLLWRLRDPAKPYVLFVMLNPSTATELHDDPTVRRVQDFAASWGPGEGGPFGGVCVANLFAFRATDPTDMKAHESPVDPPGSPGWNDREIITAARGAQFVVLAFGTHGGHQGRAGQFADILRALRASGEKIDIRALATNADGTPGHPLYLPSRLRPVPYDLDTLAT